MLDSDHQVAGLHRVVPLHTGEGARLDGFGMEIPREPIVVGTRRPQRDHAAHRSSRAIRLDVSQRRPPIFCTCE